MKEKRKAKSTAKLKNVPALPLRDVVVYPHVVVPLFVGREKSVAALETAMTMNKKILLVTQRNADEDEPDVKAIYQFGTLSVILQMLKLPDGTIKVLVEGETRCQVQDYNDSGSYLAADIVPHESDMPDKTSKERSAHKIDALMRSVLHQFDAYAKLNQKMSPEVITSLSAIEDPSRFADAIAFHSSIKIEDKQDLLETINISERMEKLLKMVESEIDILMIEKRIRGKVKKQMEKSQREYYLNEQMKAIQKELGGVDSTPNEFNEYKNKIEKSGMPKEVKSKANTELNRLNQMSPMSAEATVVRNYLDWLVDVPWKKASRLKAKLDQAETILNEDHYGLQKVKERILEYLAVQQRVKKIKGPILCLVGPPGVGKTSLGHSIARATGRKFTRMSLGGVRDEAEIRGHRRTYIGSLPGKIVQNLSRAGVKNPLFLLDEVDKMSTDFRGDPASALLEVLDSEQNSTFQDHYLEVELDLSEVMFVCTANGLNIPPPLLDRMEVIRLPGYTENEKKHIAMNYLAPRQIKNNGLKPTEIRFSTTAIIDIIRYYTREAGVRNLEREISKICRKVVKSIILIGDKDKRKLPMLITPKSLEKYLGVRKYRYGIVENEDRIGHATGLAWTEVGGEMLTIEAVTMAGKGKLVYTGQLGDVMQESVQAAVSVVRSRTLGLGIELDFYENTDIHVHVPEGATPKDGPSAGIAVCTALVSRLTNIPVLADVAMTGEITLRGEVLPVGGLKEKLLAALRGGISTVIIPGENEKDLREIPAEVRKKLTILPMRWIDEVFKVALARPLVPIEKPVSRATSVSTIKRRQNEKEARQTSRRKH